MKENMPGTHGWVDRGVSPGRWPDKPQNGFTMVLPERVREIIEQGRLNPRRLSLRESRVAAAARNQAREDYKILERQAD